MGDEGAEGRAGVMVTDYEWSACCQLSISGHTAMGERSREIDGVEANDDAAANDETTRGASSAHTSTEGQGLAPSSGYDYEVFLSFRGPDTRAAFTDFLYTRMKDAGIRVYKDDEELRVGEEFAPELLQAVNQSKISIPIFSKGYPSSVWCLKEVAQMVECQKISGQKIMPIFYDVAPSEVRHQTGGYGEAFRSHKNKKRHDEKTMQEWKDALTAVGAINGWNLHGKWENRREGEFAKALTEEVFQKLKKAYLAVSDHLVSVDNHVDAIMIMMGAQTSETRIIGIHGMGGIGKTTIAKLIYNKLLLDFEYRCFLGDIRETSKRQGIQFLQKQLIRDILKIDGIKIIKEMLSDKRVLLLLDDVDRTEHMDALVGNHGWFGKGSKLIITTRNKQVLNVPEEDLYEVGLMDPYQSLQLFSKHAFRRDSPLDEYINQSKRAVEIAGGLPLALEVIGSHLGRVGQDKDMWDAELEKLERVPHDKVQSKLKISFDALDFRQQHMFFDIACLFIEYDKNILVHFWDESNFYPKVDMKVLRNMSLIKINEYNEVWMHDQLRDLGREIILKKSGMQKEKQSRVWDPEEGLDLLTRHNVKSSPSPV
ncbi:disease resistance protein L6-like [Rhodamnia argentea]|uniref:Disease resistance protein L6-like n=1 Tax=Rhodamnia argentea TaxID=178133 RepID=A0ABM3HB92_9MYRT|nr:disease resistance protein L6-like [Rhodamnia argentea]